MEDLNFQKLDEQISRVRHLFARIEEKRRELEKDRAGYEERIRLLEGELKEAGKNGGAQKTLAKKNEEYRKSQEKVRRQVHKMLERIQSFEQ